MSEQLTVEKIKQADRIADYRVHIAYEIDGKVVPADIIVPFLLTQLSTIERETAEKCCCLSAEAYIEDQMSKYDVSDTIRNYFNLG